MNINFPYRWSPASQTLNINFYLFSSFISNKNNKTYHAPHLKPQKNKTTEEPPWDKIIDGLKPVCGRPTLALGSALVHKTKQLRTTKNEFYILLSNIQFLRIPNLPAVNSCIALMFTVHAQLDIYFKGLI